MGIIIIIHVGLLNLLCFQEYKLSKVHKWSKVHWRLGL